MLAFKPSIEISRRVVTPCARCPLRQVKTFRKFTHEELRFVEHFKAGEVRLQPGQTLLRESEKSAHLYTVLSGWLFKYKMLDDGRRQVINYALPGDLIGLQGAIFDKMQHGVDALTEVTLCAFPKDKLWTLYGAHPGLAYDVTWIAAQEKSILAEFLVSAGQRTASERIAFLLLVLFRRARDAGIVQKNSLRLPLTQEHFADTIGFSLVHTNKRLRRIKRSGAFDWTGDTFTLRDEDALSVMAGEPLELPGPRPFI